MTEIGVRAFEQYEVAGWEHVAAVYERVWSPITSQAVDPLLDAAGVESGLRVVDVGSGAGDAAARATQRGAQATGVDLSAAMVEIATRRHPATTFVEASVTELPFPDESFDAAVGNIIIQHVGEAERAARELARVLVQRGRVALSTWEAPERSPFFADEAAFQNLLRSAGFTQVSVVTISVEFPPDSADDLITALADGTVRTGALLRAADDRQRRAMGESLDDRLEEWRRGDRYVVPAPVKIASARKVD